MHEEDEHVLCPYYKRDTQQSIHCEGVQPGSGLRLGFKSQKKLKLYKQRLCRREWAQCMIAKMLNRKYDYEP